MNRWRAGEGFAELREALADYEVLLVPDAMLPALKLREYLGPTALKVAMALETGAISEPVRSGMGTHVIQLLDRERAYTPPFEEIREQVAKEWRRKLGDRALRAYLDGLRDDIEVVKALPSAAS